MKQTKKGFTLIELVVVMAIIAVLSLLIIAAIQAARRASVNTQNRGNARTIETAMEAYASTHNGAYPAAVGGKDISAITTADLPTLSQTVTGSCTNGGGTVALNGTTGFTITVYSHDCTTDAGNPITH